MGFAALDLYIRAFLARCVAMARSDQAVLEEPGIHGLKACSDGRHIRALIIDDRARDLLPTLISEAGAGMITVCSGAVRCAALLHADAGWLYGRATAMVCPDLHKVPRVALPVGLALRPVRRFAEDTPGGVPLAEAVAAASRADPGITDQRALADHLRSLPSAFDLWAAVDASEAGRELYLRLGFQSATVITRFRSSR